MRMIAESDMEHILEMSEHDQELILLKNEHFDADKWDKYMSDREVHNEE